MLLREFYNTVILSEEQCVEFLRENQLLVQAADHPPCAPCGYVMEQKRKRDRGPARAHMPPTRLSDYTVDTSGKCLLPLYLNGRLNSQLPLCGIVELVYMFKIDKPALKVVELKRVTFSWNFYVTLELFMLNLIL